MIDMQDNEENCWLLLDMARAMGGHGYDEMWRDNALPGIIGSACTTNKERFFDVT